MSNPFVEAIVGEALLNTLSQEQKDKIITQYIQNQIFGFEFDQLARGPARTHFAELVKIKVERMLLERDSEIENLIEEVIEEQFKDKRFIKEWMHKALIQKAARKILDI